MLIKLSYSFSAMILSVHQTQGSDSSINSGSSQPIMDIPFDFSLMNFPSSTEISSSQWIQDQIHPVSLYHSTLPNIENVAEHSSCLQSFDPISQQTVHPAPPTATSIPDNYEPSQGISDVLSPSNTLQSTNANNELMYHPWTVIPPQIHPSQWGGVMIHPPPRIQPQIGTTSLTQSDQPMTNFGSLIQHPTVGSNPRRNRFRSMKTVRTEWEENLIDLLNGVRKEDNQKTLKVLGRIAQLGGFKECNLNQSFFSFIDSVGWEPVKQIELQSPVISMSRLLEFIGGDPGSDEWETWFGYYNDDSMTKAGIKRNLPLVDSDVIQPDTKKSCSVSQSNQIMKLKKEMEKVLSTLNVPRIGDKDYYIKKKYRKVLYHMIDKQLSFSPTIISNMNWSDFENAIGGTISQLTRKGGCNLKSEQIDQLIGVVNSDERARFFGKMTSDQDLIIEQCAVKERYNKLINMVLNREIS